MTPIVYHSLREVVDILTTPKVLKSVPEVQELVKLLGGTKVNSSPTSFTAQQPKKLPFIVIEGLDGSGKTSVTTGVSQRLGLHLMRTPPSEITAFKDLFDDQHESVRRAYYSSGNYLAATQVSQLCSSSSPPSHKGVIMDRYWSSTAAYALTHQIMEHGPDAVSQSDFTWPADLLQPDLVIFLNVSEESRRFRHAFRNTTNTKEEQTLANSLLFRQTLIDCYKKINGPSIVEVDANNSSTTATVEENINSVVTRVCDEIKTKLDI